MYGKIFESIYDGTISVNWKGLVTFQQLIVLCDADGVVDMTPPAISRRTNIPIDIIEEGLTFLAQPDKYSRSKEYEGRRIILIDSEREWGWQIVNHKYYRNLASREDKKEKDRVRIAEKRSKNNDVDSCRNKSQMSPIQDTNTNTKANTDTPTSGFECFWEAYPKKNKQPETKDTWNGMMLDSSLDLILENIEKRKEVDSGWKRGYVSNPANYLRNREWEDEISLEKNADSKSVVQEVADAFARHNQ
jgi:hypothetical protein